MSFALFVVECARFYHEEHEGQEGVATQEYVNEFMKSCTKDRKRLSLHILGAAVVLTWVVMIGFLVRDVHFREGGQPTEGPDDPVHVEASSREWKEIYLKEKKVGYAVSFIRPFKDGYFIQEEVFLRLNLMGLGSGLFVLTQCQVDERFILKNFSLTMTSGVVRFQTTGKVEEGFLVLETGKGANRKAERIKLTRPPMMGATMGHYFRSRKIAVGETFSLPIFDPASMAQKEAVVRVVGRESITINRISYDAFRLETELWGKVLTFWVDEKGATLKEQGFMGLTTVRSSAANAPEDIDGQDDTDLYEMTAVKPDRELAKTGRLTYLKLRLEGLGRASLSMEALNQGRQRYDGGLLEIRKENLPQAGSYSLPYQDPAGEMKAYLASEYNIESDNKEIIDKARYIARGDGDPASVARKMLDWVYLNVEKRPVLSLPSALEVLRTRVGDCNEHATLLTALLRAAGIPARLSIGLVYTRDKFFYHAWTEAYLGEWVSMDPTMRQIPADVTHIKLVQGNLEKQVEIAGVMGELKLHIVDYRYD